MYDSFPELQEHNTPIFRHSKILKLQDIIKFNILELIYLYYKDQLPLKIKCNFTVNAYINAYNTRGMKLLFIPQVNITHYAIIDLLFRMTFSKILIIIITYVTQVLLNSKIT